MAAVYSEMIPDLFTSQLQAVLTAFYEDIMGVQGASGCAKAKVIKRKFEDQVDTDAADAAPPPPPPPPPPATAPAPATAAADGATATPSTDGGGDGGGDRGGDAASEEEEPPPAKAGKGVTSRGGGAKKRNTNKTLVLELEQVWHSKQAAACSCLQASRPGESKCCSKKA